MFCVPFLEDGLFKVQMFTKCKDMGRFDISQKLEIDNLYIKPNDNFSYPMMDACFVYESIDAKKGALQSQLKSEETLYITVFQNKENIVKFLQFDYFYDQIVSEVLTAKLPSKSVQDKNFPIGTFFDLRRKKIYAFFRQGESFTIDIQNPKAEIKTQCLSTRNLEGVNLFNNKILIISESQDIKFYHQKKFFDDDDVDGSKFQLKWELFQTIEQQGFFYERHNSNCFQVVTSEFIYFYEFEEIEHEESRALGNCYTIKHISTMSNFIKSTAFLTGNRQRRCIAFKYGEPNITVFMRKFAHTFVKCIDPSSKDNVSCSNLKKHDSFILTDDNHIFTHCSWCFNKTSRIDLKLASPDVEPED